MSGFWREEFVQRLFREAEVNEKEILRLTRKVPDLATLARRLAEAEGMGESLLRPGKR